MNTEVVFVNEALFFPKLKSRELDNTCAIASGTALRAIAKYYAARLGNPVLLAVDDELMQMDVFPSHCYL